MSIDSLLQLACGPLSLTLAPAFGGSILRFDHVGPDGGKTPLFRGVDSVPERIVDTASFPLVPFVNRIRGGRFDFRGRTVALAANMPPDPSPLHGQGWLAAWTAGRLTETEADLLFCYEPGEWPWAYEAHQQIRLDERGLSLALSCTNRSGEPMPCGLGQHPYFPCSSRTQLDTQVESVWTIDENVLPVEKLPAEGRYRLTGRDICGQDLDHGFGGWSGRARIADPDWPFALEMSSPEAKFFQIYSPASGGFFVAEPVTHANAALNEPEELWEGLGLKVLEPGETMQLSTRIEVVPLQ
ncbi:MAG TPA: aldose 1-epimerase [Allosphingosinicella sp.]